MAGGIIDTVARWFPRPEPLNYDPARMFNELGKDMLFAVLRWDRIVLACCTSLVELKSALSAIAKPF